MACIMVQNFCAGQAVVVSSYFNAIEPRDEWTELLVITDNTNLNNFTIRDNNGTQTNWQAEVTFNNIFWNNLRAGTVIIIWHRQYSSAGVLHPLDVNKDDGYIEAHANDATYFTGGAFGSPPSFNGYTLNVAGSGDIIQLRDPAGNHIHALGHINTPGASWTALPLPKLNHAQSLISGEAIFVCPGTNLNEYGTNAPQNGTTFTAKSGTLLTFGLPNECSTSSTANSAYWRNLRQPSWPSPSLNAAFTLPSTVNLSWNAATDPFPSDNSQGYLILRNPVNVFTHPNDGQTYVAGEIIGGATVVEVIPSSQTLSYTDTYTLTCDESVYYRIYAFRYGTDNLNGNNYNAARGRAYNETNFGTASVTIPAAPEIISVVAVDASCGNNNGSISITAGGGTPPIQYSINGGSTWQAGSFFGGLPPGNYTVVIKDSYECEVFYGSNPVNIGMIPAPVAPVSASSDRDNFCADDPGNIILTANGGSGEELHWFTGSCGGTFIGTGNNLSIPSPETTTTYFVYWTSALCGNSACASVTVTVVDIPTPSNAGPDQSLCGVLTATLAGNQPSSGSGTWSQLSGPGSSTFTDNTLFNTQVTVTVYGIYTYRWTISTGTACPDSFDDVEITFGDAITVTAGSNSPVCPGNTIMLTSSISGATYAWTGPNSFTSTEQNPQIPNATPAMEGTYSVTVSNIPGGCPNTSDDTFVDILDLPVAPVSATASPDNVCAGFTGLIQLTATGGSGTELNWYENACGGVIIGTGTTLTITAPAVTTTYFAAWTGPCGTSDCASVTVTVTDPPTPAAAGPDQSLCGVLVTFMAANDPTVGTGNWSVVTGPGTVIFSDPTAWNSQVTVSTQGIYLLRWTISNGTVCPVSEDEVELNFGDAIQVIAGSNSPVCTGQDINLTSSISGATYQWTGPAGFTSTQQNPVIYNATAANAGDYTITVTDIPGGCPSKSGTHTVVVGSIPPAPAISSQNITGSQQDVCPGSTVSYAITAAAAGATYDWALPAGGVILPGASTDIIEIEWLALSGTFLLTVSETSPEGCAGEPAQLTVNILPVIITEISISPDQNPVCYGEPVRFTATVTGGGTSPLFQWMRNGVGTGGNTPVYTLESPGYNDMITCQVVSSEPCADPLLALSNEISLNVLAPLQVDIITLGDICAGNTAILSTGGNYAAYFWSNGSSGTSMTITEAGTYWVLVTDMNGCTGADTLLIEPCEAGPVFHIPSAFSPDGDGRNDLFLPVCSHPELLSGYGMNIYNRWGQLIHSSKDIGEGWNGTQNGNPCQTGVYTYYITYKVSGESGGSGKLTGTITLLR